MTAAEAAQRIVHALRDRGIVLANRRADGGITPFALIEMAMVELAHSLEQDGHLLALFVSAEHAVKQLDSDLSATPIAHRDLKPENVIEKLVAELTRRARILEKDDELSQTIAQALLEVVESIAVAVSK